MDVTAADRALAMVATRSNGDSARMGKRAVAQSRCLGAQGKHLRLARYELGRTEGLKAIPHTKDGFDVRAAVVA